jgi:hypothetical protein
MVCSQSAEMTMRPCFGYPNDPLLRATVTLPVASFCHKKTNTVQLTGGATVLLTCNRQFRDRLLGFEGDRTRLGISKLLQSLGLEKALTRESFRRGLGKGS